MRPSPSIAVTGSLSPYKPALDGNVRQAEPGGSPKRRRDRREGEKKKRENSLPDAFTIETGKTVAKIVFVQNLPSQRCVGEEENLSLYIT